MKSTERLLEEYRFIYSDDARREAVNRLLQRAPTDGAALDLLLYVLNEENNSTIRLAIVQYLQSARPLVAIRALTKQMFDPDPLVRAHAALGVADYNDARLLAPSLVALLDALPDP